MDTSINALERALSIRRQIDTLENRLDALLGRTTSSHITTSKSRGRHMSASSRAKIAAAARARWAKVKAGQDGADKNVVKAGHRFAASPVASQWGRWLHRLVRSL